MREDRGMRGAGLLGRPVAIVLVGLLAVLLAVAPAAADPNGVGVDVVMDLRDDGGLAVTTTITAPTGRAVAQRLPLDVQVEGSRVQHFTVSDVKAENGTATVTDGALQVSAPGGTTKVAYTVRGTVENGPELQQFTWPIAAGYTVDLERLTATFGSPAAAPDSPLCGIGSPGERRLCSMTETDATGHVSMQQTGLPRGKAAVFTVLLPAGTVKADARFTSAAPSRPAEAGTAALVALSLGTVLALAVAGFALLRRRADDAAAGSAGPTADLLIPADAAGGRGGSVAFASPDGVLPGQVGALVDGRVRPSDIGATVLDLAVRGYLWIAELPGGDYQISRRAPLDGAASPAERAVVDAILPDGAESTTTGELAGGARPLALSGARSAARASVIERGWVRTLPRARRTALAFAVTEVGAIAALICAFVGATVLWALAVIILGLGLTVAALLLPERTVSGSRLAAGVGGMRQYLIATNVGALPPEQRALLFERGLPYAHAFGDLRGWVGTWGGTVGAPLDWYRSAQGPVAGLMTLGAVLDGVAAQADAAERA
ncbi:hypothetical protein [Tsukamurella sp. NPDC003166]|uniref:DUF2207 family protein n=1 Tax=Tsukamurella sp. NPDC003166 TaxID=3154444 RepID=UPI0033B125D2